MFTSVETATLILIIKKYKAETIFIFYITKQNKEEQLNGQ